MLDAILFDYNHLLLGKMKYFPTREYFIIETELQQKGYTITGKDGTKRQSEGKVRQIHYDINEVNALKIFRYAFDTYLYNWTPEDIMQYLNMDIIERLELRRFLQFIRIPPEYDEEQYLYIVSKAYPDKIKLDYAAQVIHVYEKVLEKERSAFPKNFFAESPCQKAALCLRYALNHRLDKKYLRKNVLYYYFSTNAVNQFLESCKLFNVCYEHFLTPVDFLHEALNAAQQDQALLSYYRYKNQLAYPRKKRGRKKNAAEDWILKGKNNANCDQ